MNSFNLAIIACLIASAIAAPTTETPAGQTSTTAGASSTETASSTTSPSATTPVATTQSNTSQSAPATDDSAKEQNATSPMTPTVNASSFTCYGRFIGYYADVEQECKVYHFCLLGEYQNEPVYQRISYLCLNNTVFDQQALDCVDAAKVTAPCTESAAHYESSNAILRQSIVGHKMQHSENGTTAATTA